MMPASVLQRILSRDPQVLLASPFGIWSNVHVLSDLFQLGSSDVMAFAARSPKLLTIEADNLRERQVLLRWGGGSLGRSF